MEKSIKLHKHYLWNGNLLNQWNTVGIEPKHMWLLSSNWVSIHFAEWQITKECKQIPSTGPTQLLFKKNLSQNACKVYTGGQKENETKEEIRCQLYLAVTPNWPFLSRSTLEVKVLATHVNWVHQIWVFHLTKIFEDLFAKALSWKNETSSVEV